MRTAIIVLVVVAVGVGLWFLFANQTNAPTTNTNTAATNTTTNRATNTATTNTTVNTNAAAASSYQTYAPFAGSWSGNWQNTTFGSTGSMTGGLTVNQDGTAELVLDVNGNVFGLGDPDPKTLAGTYNTDAMTFSSVGDSFFGDLTMTFSADGTVAASGAQIPASSVDALTIQGTVTESGLNGTYTVAVGGAVFARGTLSLEKS